MRGSYAATVLSARPGCSRPFAGGRSRRSNSSALSKEHRSSQGELSSTGDEVQYRTGRQRYRNQPASGFVTCGSNLSLEAVLRHDRDWTFSDNRGAVPMAAFGTAAFSFSFQLRCVGGACCLGFVACRSGWSMGAHITSCCSSLNSSLYLFVLVRFDQHIIGTLLQDIHPQLVIAQA